LGKIAGPKRREYFGHLYDRAFLTDPDRSVAWYFYPKASGRTTDQVRADIRSAAALSDPPVPGRAEVVMGKDGPPPGRWMKILTIEEVEQQLSVQ
jgi:hypothetical protein